MEEGIHQHCLGCIKTWKCSYRPDVGQLCEIIPCDLDCGARFHTCKRKEHQLLCPNEKVPCINAGNGCPSLLQRKFLGVHLKICPASVIYCTMEWNRWPIQDARSQFSQQIYQRVFRRAQLDVALAMRDQRMLWRRWTSSRLSDESFKSAAIRRASTELLSHPLNLCECESSEIKHVNRSATSDERDVFWELKKYLSQSQRNIYSEVYKASCKTCETPSTALSVTTECSDINTIPDTCNDVSESFSVMSNAAKELQLQEENKENIMDYLNYNDSVYSASKYKYDSSITNMYNPSLHMEYSSSCDFCVLPDGSRHRLGNGNSRSTHEFNPERVIEMEHGCDVVFANDTTVSEISSASILDHARKDVIPPVNSPFGLSENFLHLSTWPWCVALGLDLNLESFTRYKAKPRSMYTFLCAQVFRRDEYAWHYKNVHGDIHGGLNGWLEERCPLAQYGCIFSRRRFYPAPEGSSIVHNMTLESFGVKPPDCSLKCNESTDLRCFDQPRYHANIKSEVINEIHHVQNGEIVQDETYAVPININQLPFEILQHVARFLDSFSLCNLSLTSHLLRDVCHSLLEERGVVIFQWERQRKCDGYSWIIAHKRWFFSSSFTPIKQWCFEDSYNMANHLKTCAYFKRNLKYDPYYYPMSLEPNDQTYQKLKDHAAGLFPSAFENVSTKL